MIRRVLSQETARKVSGILEGVVSKKGTAEKAAIPGFRVAGKTGTAKKIDEQTGKYSNRKHVSIFVGFVPVNDPKMVILVAIDEPKGVTYGGLIAGPVFSEVGKWALNNMHVQPDLEVASMDTAREARVDNVPATRSNVVRKPIIEETADTESPGASRIFSGQTIRQVLQKGNSLGLAVVIDGTGKAVMQSPDPGTPLEGITSIRVTFRPAV